LRDAIEQVGVLGERLALIHLAYSRILLEALGKKKGKEAVLKAMMEYGRLVGERNKAGRQDLPFYGIQERCTYDGKEFVDKRQRPGGAGEEFDFSRFQVQGCIFAKVFQEYGEKELGCLYCYVDAAKSMASDPAKKLIHTSCEAAGDKYCGFTVAPTTEKERDDFESRDVAWKEADPVLLEGSGLGKD
jgi:hypothetical protein